MKQKKKYIFREFSGVSKIHFEKKKEFSSDFKECGEI